MFQGSIVAIVTPMRKDGSVDEQALAELVEFHVDAGTDGIVSVGTTGESATLDVPEHMSVIKKTIELVRKRIPVIAGTGANSTSEAIELSQAARDLGADGCLLVTPYYNKPTQEGLYQHFAAIAKAGRYANRIILIQQINLRNHSISLEWFFIFAAWQIKTINLRR